MYVEPRQSGLKNEPCDVIKMRDEERGEKGNTLKRDGSIDVTRQGSFLSSLYYIIKRYAQVKLFSNMLGKRSCIFFYF